MVMWLKSAKLYALA